MQLPRGNITKSLRSKARLRSQLNVLQSEGGETKGGRSTAARPHPDLSCPAQIPPGSPRGAPRYPAPIQGRGQSKVPTTCHLWGGTDGAHRVLSPWGEASRGSGGAPGPATPSWSHPMPRSSLGAALLQHSHRPPGCWLPARLCSAITRLSCQPPAQSPRLSPASCSASLHLPSPSTRLDTTLFCREPQLRPGTAAAFEDTSSARPHRAPTKGKPHDLSSSSQ